MHTITHHKRAQFHQLAVLIALLGLTILGTIFVVAQPIPLNPEPTDEQPSITFMPTSETVCDGIACAKTYYSYQKYWINENNEWQEIDESFGVTNCAVGYTHCVDNNLYQAHINLPNHEVLITYEGQEITIIPDSLKYRNELNEEELITTFNDQATLEVSENTATFQNAFGEGIHLQFTYLPDKLKEEIIITENAQLQPPTLAGEVTLDADFILDLSTNEPLTPLIEDVPFEATAPLQATQDWIPLTLADEPFLFIPPGIAYDAEGIALSLTQALYSENNQTYATLKTPYAWLTNDQLTYPLTLDPTVTLNFKDIHWNGEVENTTAITCGTTNCYQRFNNPRTLYTGAYTGSAFRRIGIDWNISDVPDESDIQKLNLVVHSVSNPGGVVLNINEMGGGSDDYGDDEDECDGNCKFFGDMHDGILYGNETVTAIQEINISLKAQDNFTQVKYTDIFSIGLTLDDPSDRLNLAAKDNTNQSRRPTLYVEYELWANETAGDDAILVGINTELPSALTHTEKQVYTRTKTNTQELGTFDYYVQSDNKRWAINYITEGETFTEMSSISDRFHVLELTNMTASNIQTQVENFISSTL